MEGQDSEENFLTLNLDYESNKDRINLQIQFIFKAGVGTRK
jgi:hypothetical protein